jgi:RHS repeat-associated protein
LRRDGTTSKRQAGRAEARADQALADAIRLETEATALHAGADAAQQQADQLLIGIGEQQAALQALESAIADLLAEAAHHQHLADNPPQREQIRHFIYDLQGQLLGEYREDGTPLREYLHADGTPLMMVYYTPDEAALYWYHTDHLGTPQALTDRHGQIAWQAQYDPFGEVVLLVNNVTQPLRFPGQYFDEETGLHYNYFRDYDPGTGRYVQSDPIGVMRDYSSPQLRLAIATEMLRKSSAAASLNHLYGYAEQNPVRWMDPTGLDLYVSINSRGAYGAGHVGGAANSSATSGFYPKFPSTLAPGVVRLDTNIDGMVVIPATPEQDQKFSQCMEERRKNPGIYAISSRNCTGFVQSCLAKAGISGYNNSNLPKRFFCSIARKYGCEGEYCDSCE